MTRKPGRERDAGRLLHEIGEPLLELDVDVERAVQEPAAGAARAVLPDGRDRPLLDLRVRGQAEVVVRPEHDHLAAAHRDDRVLGRLDGPEEREEAGGAKLVRVPYKFDTCRKVSGSQAGLRDDMRPTEHRFILCGRGPRPVVLSHFVVLCPWNFTTSVRDPAAREIPLPGEPGARLENRFEMADPAPLVRLTRRRPRPSGAARLPCRR